MSQFDPVIYTPEEVIHFSNGLPGFEDNHDFVIYTRPEHEPFHWMISVQGQPVQFVLINPLLISPEYDPKFSALELKELDVLDPKELLLYVIVTVQEEMSDSTANFLGPIFVNIRTRQGRQILIEDARYSTNQRILGGC
jgi:flagellar assembly factor FliW